MNQWQSSRVSSISPSATLGMTDRVKYMRSLGEHVIGLATGTPDFDTPLHIKEAAKSAISEDITYMVYTISMGLPELREAIVQKLKQENFINVSVDQVLVTIGVKEGIYNAIQACFNPGDEVLIPTPTWVTYEACFILAGVVPVFIPCESSNQFQLDPDLLESKITKKTKAIMLNSPGNPSGVVYNNETLQAIANISKKHDLLVMSDEIYEYMVYGPSKHISIASLPDMMDRTLTFNGFSKSYAMTGWRVGYVAGPKSIIKNISKIHGHSVTCACAFAQKAATIALTSHQNDLKKYIEILYQRRQQLVDGLNSISGIHCASPDGGIFCFPDISALGMSDTECSSFILEEAKVSSLPGSAFGPGGEGHLRMNFARRNAQDIDDAVQRIKQALLKL
jgi:aspartate/methionine/tyrosine aminotransferase